MNKNLMRQYGFGKQVDAVEHSFCPTCQKPIVMEDFRNAISVKEYKISGMCQKCQDSIFGED